MAHLTLLRESLIPTTSPLRRKSMLTLNTSDASLHQNDDDAERMERRLNAEIEMRQRDSVTSPSSDKRKSIGGSIAGLSPAQLADHYANCIKLSAQNKINTKNAFSLQLIDYMAMMLKKRDSKMDNFQVASCTLDASTKIYAYRVDSVHTDVLKMAGGLAVGYRKRNIDNEGEGENDQGGGNNSEEMSVIKRRKTRKPKNTIPNNIETLNAKPDLEYSMDPFFLRSSGNMSDCQPGDSHFLTSLKVHPNCSLVFSSDMPYWSIKDDAASRDINVLLPPIPDLNNKTICSVFSQFKFTSWSLEEDDSTYNLSREPMTLLDADDEFAFDVNAVPEAVPTCDTEVQVDNEVPGVDDFDSDEEAADACATAHKTSAAKVVDLRKHLSASPREYSYFSSEALNLWAGPSHWKIKPVRLCGSKTGDDPERDGDKNQKSKQKKELSVAFESRDYSSTFSIVSNRESLTLTKRTVQKVWSAEKNTYPPDVHYDSKNFQKLQIRQLIGINMDSSPVEDEQTSGYNYENDRDKTEYCPNVDDDDVDDEFDDDAGGQHQDVHTNLGMEDMLSSFPFAGDNLVAPPNKVARMFIPYAQRAKKMDMKKLKAAIWDILVDAESYKEMIDREKLKIQVPIKFSYLYKLLPSRLSSVLAENLSAPLALVAVLHLANEKNLNIEGEETFDDLIISQE